MNKELLRFHCGGEDRYGRTLNGMMAYSDSYLEHSHNVVQWLFPTVRPSDHIKDSPTLDSETIMVLSLPSMQGGIYRAYCRFWDFYDLNQVCCKNPWKSPIASYGTYDHNYKRLTRILDCLTTLKIESATSGISLAQGLLNILLQIPNVPNRVKLHWDSAVYDNKGGSM